MRVMLKYAGMEHMKNRTELEESNRLTIGQVFDAVARHYGKKSKDYPSWPKFNSAEYLRIKGELAVLDNDLLRINAVCEILGEKAL